jgi:hypothetical protein
MPALGAHAAEEAGYYWIIDDTGFAGKGRHSAGWHVSIAGSSGSQYDSRGSEAGRRGEVKRGLAYCQSRKSVGGATTRRLVSGHGGQHEPG